MRTTGYRSYSASQLDRACLIGALRQPQIPLAEIKLIVSLEPEAAAQRIGAHWTVIGDDSDGRLEWCRPVPAEQAQQLAIHVPELALRDEPAHREAFIHLGPQGEIEPVQWQLLTLALRSWVQEHKIEPNLLGARMTYLADATVPAARAPDCDFAIPFD
jgi:DNA-binding transcriptional MerR regulator